MAEKLGMTQGNVSNMMRALKLPKSILDKIDEGKITYSMGRELLIFLGKSAGSTKRWSNKEGTEMEIPKDEEWLMKEACREIGGNYGPPATKDGMIKAIYRVCDANFRHLEKEGYSYYASQREPLFDTRATGCLNCPNMVRAFETKTQVKHYCTNFECWDRHQEEHKAIQAENAKKQMQEDIARRIAAEGARVQEAAGNISQEITKPNFKLEKRGTGWIALDDDGRVIAMDTKKDQCETEAYLSFKPVATIENPAPEEYMLNHTYRIVLKMGKRTTGFVSDYTAQDAATAVMESGVDPDDIEQVKVHKSSGKIGTGGDVSAGWSKCTEPLVSPAEVLEQIEEDDDIRNMDMDYDEDEEESPDTAPAEVERFDTLEEVCKGCINQKQCTGTGRRPASYTGSPDDQGKYVCMDRLTKANWGDLQKRIRESVPPALKEMAKKQAGTRADVLDIRDLRLGYYGELKAGFVWLTEENIGRMEDPAECTDRCTQGFHYAFDSSKTDGEVYHVCTNPKCVAKKKGALTRTKNADANAKKKAEQAAFKTAVEATTGIDRPRMRLIIHAQINGSHVDENRSWSTSGQVKWFAKFLATKEDAGAIEKAVDKLNDQEMARLIVNFMLSSLMYQDRDPSNRYGSNKDYSEYKIQTTEVLNWMGVGIQVKKQEGGKEPTEK